MEIEMRIPDVILNGRWYFLCVKTGNWLDITPEA